MHRYVHEPWLEGWSTMRSTDPKSSLSGSGPGRPGGRPAIELCYLVLASTVWSTDRSRLGCDRPSNRLASPMVINKTVGWSTDRSSGLGIEPQRLVFVAL